MLTSLTVLLLRKPKSHSDPFLYYLFFSSWGLEAVSLYSAFWSFTATGIDVGGFHPLSWGLNEPFQSGNAHLPVQGIFLDFFDYPPPSIISDIFLEVLFEYWISWSGPPLFTFLSCFSSFFYFLGDCLYFIFQSFSWYPPPLLLSWAVTLLKSSFILNQCSLCTACFSSFRFAILSFTSLGILIFTMFSFSVSWGCIFLFLFAIFPQIK